jgi:hypothetical protein
MTGAWRYGSEPVTRLRQLAFVGYLSRVTVATRPELYFTSTWPNCGGSYGGILGSNLTDFDWHSK